MAVHVEDPEQVLYARWEIHVFCSIERASDYKKTKACLLRTLNGGLGTNTLRGRMRSWWSLFSDKDPAAIIAIGTVALVLLTLALLIVALLLEALNRSSLT
jgi:hypothetical protein